MFQVAEKKKKKKENGTNKVSTVKAQLKPERKKMRKKLRKSALREESLKGINEVSVNRLQKFKDRCYAMLLDVHDHIYNMLPFNLNGSIA